MGAGRAWRNLGFATAATVVVLGCAGFAVFELAGEASHATGAATSSGAVRSAPRTVQSQSAGPSSPSGGSPTGPAGTPPGSASPGAATAPPQGSVLVAGSARAFGENGLSDGDDPQRAAGVLTGSGSAWQTHWYSTAAFGQLKSGTGLLLDLGAARTVTGLRVTLGTGSGAVLELRAAGQRLPQVPGAFQPAARVSDPGDTVTFTPATPVQARYLLLWCTRLPPNPNGDGTFQLVVRHVAVYGRP